MMRSWKSLLFMALIAAIILAGDLFYAAHNLEALIDNGFKGINAKIAPWRIEYGGVQAMGLRDIELVDLKLLTEDRQEILSARRVRAEAPLGALLRGEGPEILLEGVDIRIHRDREGNWDIPNLHQSEGGKSRSPALRLRLRNTTVICVDDRTFAPGTEHVVAVKELTATLEEGGRLEIHGGKLDVKGVGTLHLHHLSVDRESGVLKAKVRIEGVNLEEALPGRLPLGQASELWAMLKPSGQMTLEADLVLDLETNRPLALRGIASLRRVKVESSEFPYPMEDLSGTIEMRDDRIEIDLGGTFGDGDLELTGSVTSIFDSPEVSLQARIEEVVADATLRQALQRAIGEGETFDDFSPRGPFGQVNASYHRSGTTGEGRLKVVLEPRRVSMAYAGFPYRIEDIHSGTLTIEVTFPAEGEKGKEPITVTLDRLRGRHGEGRVRGDGTWRRTEAGTIVDLQFNAEMIDMAPDLRAAVLELGEETGDLWDGFGPSGSANVQVALRKDPDGKLESYVDVEFQGSTIHPTLAAYRFDDMRGRLSLNPSGFEVKDLRARHGSGRFVWNGKGEILEEGHVGRFHLKCEDVALDEDFRHLLASVSREALEVYDEFEVSGRVRGELEMVVGAPGDRLEWLKIFPQGASVLYKGFRYPFEGVTGEVDVDMETGQVSIPGIFARLHGGGEGILRGRFGVGPTKGEMDLEAFVADLHLDETLRLALPVDSEAEEEGRRKIWDDLNPEGTVDGKIHVTRSGRETLIVRGVGKLVDVSMLPEAFPLRIRGLKGDVPFDLEFDSHGPSRGQLLFGDLEGKTPIRGERDETRFSFWGGVDFEGGEPDLKVNIVAYDLRVDPVLRDALPAKAGEAFDELRPEGWADVDAVLRLDSEGERVDWKARLTDVLVRYRPFPFPIRASEGTITARNGRLTIEGIRGRNGDATVFVDGHTEKDGEVIHLSIRAERLPLVERVRVLLPDSLARTWKDLGLEGEVDFDLRMRADHRALLVLIEGETREMAIQFGTDGLRFEELAGLLQVEMEVFNAGPEKGGVQLQGHIVNLSGAYRERPIEELSAHVRYTRTAGEEGVGRLDYDNIQGKFIGGRLTGKIGLDLGDDVGYAGHLRLEDGRLEVALSHLEESRQAAGNVTADITFAGKGGDPEATRGEGEVKIADGDFIKVPAISGLLKAFGFQETFDSLELDLTLEAEEASIEMTLSSGALSIIGRGSMGYNGTIDITATTELGPPLFSKIPLIGYLWNWIKGTINAWKVEGTLENVEVSYRPFSSWSDALEAFGE